MTAPTTQEKLETVKELIEVFRQTARSPAEDRRILALKGIASDLRARLDGAPNVALVELERRMTAVRRHAPGSGSARVNAQIGVAEELVCRWPVVTQALEKFGAEIEEGTTLWVKR